MRPIVAIASAGVLAMIVAAWWAWPSGDQTGLEMVDVAAGERLYSENCASCHGAKLDGQPDWRSTGPDGLMPVPPHDESGHTWHHVDGVLFDYTMLGGTAALAELGVKFNSGMPEFSDKPTWPVRQRDLQAERTDAERLESDSSD